MQRSATILFITVMCILAVTLACDPQLLRKKAPELDPHKEPVAGMREFVSAVPDNFPFENLRIGVSNMEIIENQLDLVPTILNVFVFKNYAVRVKRSLKYDDGETFEVMQDILEVIPVDNSEENAVPIASFEIPVESQLYRAGDLLVTLQVNRVSDDETQTDIQVYDFSDPEHPRKAGSLDTDQLEPNRMMREPYFFARQEIDAMEAGYPYSPIGIIALDNSLIFLHRHYDKKLIGEETVCYTNADNNNSPTVPPLFDTMPTGVSPETDFPVLMIPLPPSTFYQGTIECHSPEDEEPVCSGAIERCQRYEDFCIACEEIDSSLIETVTYCRQQERYENWTYATMDVVDLTDPDNPRLGKRVEMPHDEHDVWVVTQGDVLYYSYRVPYEVEDDTKKYARHYFKEIDLQRPQRPVIGPEINIPGSLLKIDNNIAYTYDFFWKGNTPEASLNQLVLVNDDHAELQERHGFEDQFVLDIRFSDDGALAVASYLDIDMFKMFNTCPVLEEYKNPEQFMATISLDDDGLPVKGKIKVPSLTDIRAIHASRIVMTGRDGLSIANVENPEHPFIQAVHPFNSEVRNIQFHDMKLMFASGSYDSYQYDLEESNVIIVPH